ncbi:sigma 54-interacting transcriptional regulator [Thiomicrospira microaerophila]|uniref:sigma-54 interaction domain-containing protein n=1 Tax=Thiomicrospira microaerophila TaxID=406020 RepID=UPI00200C8A9F|nr:sigma 54-interacting transcriptional regulator [Thiomicrospira microaerophila]UQB42190.1 sigma 54-interacting transcriptional regulator [Thiomicrospira microaerophila]
MSLFGLFFTQLPEACILVDPFSNRVCYRNQKAEALLNASVIATELFSSSSGKLVVFTEEVLEKKQAWSADLTIRLKENDKSLAVETLGFEVKRSELDKPLIAMVLTSKPNLAQRRQLAEVHRLHRDGLDYWKTIEQTFREFERDNDLILQSVGDGIYGVDIHGNATFVNPACERILGWRAQEMIGKNVHDLIHHHYPDGKHYHGHDCPIYSAFRDGEIRQVDDEVFWSKTGQVIPVAYTSTPILDSGQLVGAVVVFRDISERIRAEERLKQALKEVQALKQRLEAENDYLHETYRIEHNYKSIVGRSSAILKTIKQIDLVATTDASVLITGESGTGKELIAQAIHQASHRAKQPFIKVNCASIPQELFESEFFGHIKGAFTGAIQDRIGRFELANNGTLFLDEVGEIPLALQSKLLRVLQEGEFERVGESKTRKINVRILAATNRDLLLEVSAKRFREDLFFRLNVFPIASYPLRERREDVPLLVEHFLQLVQRKFNRQGLHISQADMQQMQAYDWPGNIRELVNVIERGVILAQSDKYVLELPQTSAFQTGASTKLARERVDTLSSFAEIEKRALINALIHTNGKVFGKDGAAQLLDLKPTTLNSKLKKHRINRHEFVILK